RRWYVGRWWPCSVGRRPRGRNFRWRVGAVGACACSRRTSALELAHFVTELAESERGAGLGRVETRWPTAAAKQASLPQVPGVILLWSLEDAIVALEPNDPT